MKLVDSGSLEIGILASTAVSDVTINYLKRIKVFFCASTLMYVLKQQILCITMNNDHLCQAQ